MSILTNTAPRFGLVAAGLGLLGLLGVSLPARAQSSECPDGQILRLTDGSEEEYDQVALAAQACSEEAIAFAIGGLGTGCGEAGQASEEAARLEVFVLSIEGLGGGAGAAGGTDDSLHNFQEDEEAADFVVLFMVSDLGGGSARKVVARSFFIDTSGTVAGPAVFEGVAHLSISTSAGQNWNLTITVNQDGTATITAESGSASSTSDSPVALRQVTASENPVADMDTVLTLTGVNPASTIRWTSDDLTSTNFSPNDTSNPVTVSFDHAGTHLIVGEEQNGSGQTIGIGVIIIAVSQTLTTLTVSPDGATIPTGDQQQYTAAGTDQFGDSMTPTVAWTATGGTIDGSGLYTAGATPGSFSVEAASGAVMDSASLTIGGLVFQASFGTCSLGTWTDTGPGFFSPAPCNPEVGDMTFSTNAPPNIISVVPGMTGQALSLFKGAPHEAGNSPEVQGHLAGPVTTGDLTVSFQVQRKSVNGGSGSFFAAVLGPGNFSVTTINFGFPSDTEILYRVGDGFSDGGSGPAYQAVATGVSNSVDSVITVTIVIHMATRTFDITLSSSAGGSHSSSGNNFHFASLFEIDRIFFEIGGSSNAEGVNYWIDDVRATR